MRIQEIIHKWEMEILTYEKALEIPLSNSTKEEFTIILNTMKSCLEDLKQEQSKE